MIKNDEEIEPQLDASKQCRICRRPLDKRFSDWYAKENPEEEQYSPCCKYVKPNKKPWFVDCYRLGYWIQMPTYRQIIQPLRFKIDESWIFSYRGGYLCMCGNWIFFDMDAHKIIEPDQIRFRQQRLNGKSEKAKPNFAQRRPVIDIIYSLCRDSPKDVSFENIVKKTDHSRIDRKIVEGTIYYLNLHSRIFSSTTGIFKIVKEDHKDE